MKDPIDKNFMAVNSPAQASDYYLPFVLSGTMDLSTVRKELKNKHKFSEEDIRITARVLSNAHMKHTEHKSIAAGGYLGLVIGVVVLLGGIMLTLYLWDKGFIASASLVIIATGLLIIFQSNKRIRGKG